jgi:hypothetical protein
MAQSESEILVEEIPKKATHPVVRPPAVYQEQSFQKPELGYGIIRRQNRLHPLLT